MTTRVPDSPSWKHRGFSRGCCRFSSRYFTCMNNSDSAKEREEVRELLERCRKTEKELEDIKERLNKIQRALGEELARNKLKRRDGLSSKAQPRRALFLDS